VSKYVFKRVGKMHLNSYMPSSKFRWTYTVFEVSHIVTFIIIINIIINMSVHYSINNSINLIITLI